MDDAERVAWTSCRDQSGSVFEHLVAAGEVRRATGKGISDLLPIPPAPPGERSLSEILQEMRDEDQRRYAIPAA